MKFFAFTCVTVFILVLSACAPASATANLQTDSFDWRSDWAVADGFSIDIDSEGYSFPTGIAFVPNPGSRPKDPLYFVTELRGKVKVITNDRSIHTFAEDFFSLTPREELPSDQGQVGLAGICLEPKNGYVFVTFAYQDQNNVLRNNIVRFQSEPEQFSLKPAAQVEFTDVFLPYESGLAHQIGQCQVKEDSLYVSVGEGWQSFKAQQLDAMNGKVIHMSLDGKPMPDNPFYQDDNVQNAANYVWAYGLRNPFGLKLIGDRVFVAENGRNIDRFLEIHKGINYLWDGNDNSIASNADFVFVPSRAPVQLDRYPDGSSVFPAEYRQSFFMGLSAFDMNNGKIPGIMAISFGLEENRVLSTPEYFVKYRGSEKQAVTAIAFGPDGLYFAPLLPNREGRTFILKITYDPGRAHPFSTLQTENGDDLFIEKGCVGCHSITGVREMGGTAGPPLDRDLLVERLETRLHSQAYLESLEEIDQLDSEPQASYREARQEVLEAEGLDRVRVWMIHRIQEPRFDTLYSQMPNVGVSREEAILLTEYLLDENPQANGLRALLPRSFGTKHFVAIAFVGGFVTALFTGGAWRLAGVYRTRRRETIEKQR